MIIDWVPNTLPAIFPGSKVIITLLFLRSKLVSLSPSLSSAKNSVKLTKKYGKCLPAEGQEGMGNVYRNMRFVSRIICDNVNKRSECV